jgi:uncharacterized protein with GYD domain
METFILLTQLTHATPETDDITPDAAERHVVERIRAACPEAEWLNSFAVLGPYDYLDIFQAPNVETAVKVATIVRRLGHARVEVWGATEWTRFKDLARDAVPASSA